MVKGNIVDFEGSYKQENNLLKFMVCFGFIAIPVYLHFGISIAFGYLDFLILIISIISLIFTRNRSNTKDHFIELNENLIQIKNKSGKIKKEFALDENVKVAIFNFHNKLKVPEEKPRTDFNTLDLDNRLIIQTKGAQDQIDFKLDSFYNLEQLRQKIKYWNSKNRTLQEVKYLD